MFTQAELSLIYNSLRVSKQEWERLHNSKGNLNREGERITHVFETNAKDAAELRCKIEKIFAGGFQ